MQTKKIAPIKQTTVVFDKKRVSVSIKRMDLTEMAARSEIMLPPQVQSGNEKNNNSADSVTSSPNNTNEAADTVPVLESTSSDLSPAQKVTLMFSKFLYFIFSIFFFLLGKCCDCKFYAK